MYGRFGYPGRGTDQVATPGTALERHYASVPIEHRRRRSAWRLRVSHRCRPRAGNQEARGTTATSWQARGHGSECPKPFSVRSQHTPSEGPAFRDCHQVMYNLSISTNSPSPVLLQIQRSRAGTPVRIQGGRGAGIPAGS